MPDDFDPDALNPEDNSSFKALRDAYKRAEKEKKEFEKQLGELTPKLQEYVEKERFAKVETTFKEVGLDPKISKLFFGANPDAEITPDAVKAFAAEYGFQTEQGTQVDPPAADGFDPQAVGSGTSAGLKMYTPQEITAMLKEGKTEEANRAVKEGRMIKEDVPWSTQRA